ncbi:DUF262 domain-containing protein [Mesorhizobium sp. L2C066B000]|uniref:DUF262 domain-containing protein n=1 Tax=Mesorhizobium sp. L2C066B000 TaxID=1287105 RepID=UPI0003CFB4B2|nr:DUF262 domain-containing protein [Mesorhizobium sp. L2C066B000]ESZ39513.1 hypothetical protein X732_15065 [Mesorhizobium sp. L2C066B000]
MQLNPMHLKIAGLLSGRLFRIPEYQRAYAWGTKQRTDFFNDIRDVARSGRDHFMATVVGLGKDTRQIGADEFREVELVDGQQRITTIIILLKSIFQHLSLDDEKEVRLRREINELLVKSDDNSLILLQTNHDTSNVFTTYMKNGAIISPKHPTSADVNLLKAINECDGFVVGWGESSSLVELVALIRNRLSVIYHEILDEATVYRVFEVLNSRGLDVKWVDKLKSQLMALLFEHGEVGSRKDALREMQGIWQAIYRVLGLRSDLGDEALRFSGTWTRDARPNKILSQEDAATELTLAAGSKLPSIIHIAKDLFDVVEAVQDLSANVRYNAVTRIAQARFVAISILLRKFDKQNEAELLQQWERVIFRVYGLGGADARHKVGEFVRLGHDIIRKTLKPADIKAQLLEIGEDYPIDDILYGPEYWDYSYDDWAEELRYLLFRYEEYLCEVAGEKINKGQWNKIWMVDPSKSIEHIQPQSSGVSYVHNIGNLVMLPPGLNSALGARAPKEKAPEYVASGLKQAAKIGTALENGKKWNKDAVLARAADIERFVKREWGEKN